MVGTSWFPEAAVTDRHRLDGLKQQIFIFSLFWRSESKAAAAAGSTASADSGTAAPAALLTLGMRAVLGVPGVNSASASVLTGPLL